MSNKDKLLVAAVVALFLSDVFPPLILLSIFLFFVYFNVDKAEKLEKERKAKENKPSCCPDCGRRRYLVFPKGSKNSLSLTGFTRYKITEYRCQDCEHTWEDFEVDSYQGFF